MKIDDLVGWKRGLKSFWDLKIMMLHHACRKFEIKKKIIKKILKGYSRVACGGGRNELE